jgi:hypothetical protein
MRSLTRGNVVLENKTSIPRDFVIIRKRFVIGQEPPVVEAVTINHKLDVQFATHKIVICDTVNNTGVGKEVCPRIEILEKWNGISWYPRKLTNEQWAPKESFQ